MLRIGRIDLSLLIVLRASPEERLRTKRYLECSKRKPRPARSGAGSPRADLYWTQHERKVQSIRMDLDKKAANYAP